jgi:Zn-dependent protease with chaperone function
MLGTPRIIQTTAQAAAVIHLTVPRSDMMKVFGPAVGELMATLAAQGVKPEGALFAHPYHTNRQRGLFGPTSELNNVHSAWETVQVLARQMGVGIKTVLLDRDIRNADALAFGFSETRTILMGKGLLFLSVTQPLEFTARIAHEIGHFKNGDVTYAFLSRALLQANLLLMALILVWLLFCRLE